MNFKSLLKRDVINKTQEVKKDINLKDLLNRIERHPGYKEFKDKPLLIEGKPIDSISYKEDTIVLVEGDFNKMILKKDINTTSEDDKMNWTNLDNGQRSGRPKKTVMSVDDFIEVMKEDVKKSPSITVYIASDHSFSDKKPIVDIKISDDTLNII